MVCDQLVEAVRNGRVKEVKELTQSAIDQGIAPNVIIDEGLVKGMGVVGELFGKGEMFVPEVMMASKAMNAGMELIKPLIKAGDITSKGTCVFATVKGDLHDIGKKLVVLMLEGASFRIIDLGVDVKPQAIVDAVKKENASIVGLSAMLTTTMSVMKEVCDMLKENGLDGVKVMIGGAPVSHDYAAKIGANYAKDATEAVELANRLVKN
jgi:5-methyltetrahydrofolate--homocysteine methyltransferase